MKKKKLWILVIAILAVSLPVFMVFSNQGEDVELTVAEKGDIKEYVEDIGTVRCKEQKAASIEGSGLILEVNAEIGQQVKKGDLLLSMDKELLRIQLKDAEEKIKEIEASIQGSEIKNYASTVDKARIAVNRAKDTYEAALDDFNKAEVLSKAGAVSAAELKQREEALKAAKALMDTAEIDLQQIEANTPDSVKAVYKARLEQVMLSRESILRSLKKQELKSPIDGVILERNAEVNTVGVPGTIAFVVGNLDNVEIEAGILADEVTDIKLGDEAEIVERSGRKQVIAGKVVKIAPSAVAVTSSLGVNQKRVYVIIEPAEQSGLLRPGYEVDVRIITKSKKDILKVPLSSVFDYKGKDHVFAVVEGKAVLRAVKKGIQDEDFVEILEGLKEGELVLSEPDINTKEGMRVKLGNRK